MHHKNPSGPKRVLDIQHNVVHRQSWCGGRERWDLVRLQVIRTEGALPTSSSTLVSCAQWKPHLIAAEACHGCPKKGKPQALRAHVGSQDLELRDQAETPLTPSKSQILEVKPLQTFPSARLRVDLKPLQPQAWGQGGDPARKRLPALPPEYAGHMEGPPAPRRFDENRSQEMRWNADMRMSPAQVRASASVRIYGWRKSLRPAGNMLIFLVLCT